MLYNMLVCAPTELARRVPRDSKSHRGHIPHHAILASRPSRVTTLSRPSRASRPASRPAPPPAPLPRAPRPAFGTWSMPSLRNSRPSS